MTGGAVIDELISAYRPGWSLPQGFYLRPDVFEADLRLLEDRWVCAGHVSEAGAAGDWFTTELGAESAIIVRGEDGVLRALANVCRHRGSRLCVEPRGQSTLFTCPYHAWSYHLDGRLRAAREMPDGFSIRPRSASSPCRSRSSAAHLVFVSFGPAPPPFGEAEPALASMTALYGWESARIAHRQTYRVAANWKLVMENYHECYHCGPAHPEFSRSSTRWRRS